jgi:hypothetical protein
MQGVIFLKKHFTNDLADSTLLGMSDSSFTNDQLSLEWLKHFDKETNKCGRHPIAKRLLIMDGHGSHLTVDFVEYCDLHGIIPFLLPPHATHLL